MNDSRQHASLSLDEFVAGITGTPDPAEAAAFARAITCGYNPDEPRDWRGRWTTADGADGGAGSAGATMSKEAQALRDLLRANRQIREFLAKVAKESKKVERGGFILKRVKGDGAPYKIVEEMPKSPQADSIHLEAWPPKAGGNWDGAHLPECPSFGSIDMSKVPPNPKLDPNYAVEFWWHSHISGWGTAQDGLPVQGEPHPSRADFLNKGVAGLMVKSDQTLGKLRTFIIEHQGQKFHEIDSDLSGK